mmetsp:Transcript_14952/g.34062  ORF Transcript_14952/g.34062 Transcript_14952/m.34062 type:complete len:432 (-) Transcript_14952:129-1424(-)
MTASSPLRPIRASAPLLPAFLLTILAAGCLNFVQSSFKQTSTSPALRSAVARSAMPFRGKKNVVDVEEVETDENETESADVDATADVARNDTVEEDKTEENAKPRGTKVAIITGASTGIGLSTVEGMAKSGLYKTIVMAGRDAAKHEVAMAGLQKKLGEDVEFVFLPLELSSLQSVRDFVKEFQEMDLPLHTLILNAGVMMLPERKTTEDGYEYQFGVNHLSHFLLANLLLDDMAEVATASDPGRVIALSSAAHFFPSPLLKGKVNDLQSVRYTPVGAYGQSKLANLLFAYELDRRLAAKGVPITANAIHPGGVDTELGRYITGENSFLEKIQSFLPKNTFTKTPEEGAKTSVLLATSDFGKMSGRYWQNEKPAASVSFDLTSGMISEKNLPFQASVTSYDPKVWEQLWTESEKLVSLTSDEAPQVFKSEE